MTQQQKLYLSLFIITAVLASFLLGGGWFLTHGIKVRAENLSKKRQDIQALYQNWQNLEISKRSLKNQLEDKIIQDTILKKERALDFILELEKTAQRVNCQQNIESITPAAAGSDKTKKAREIAFQATLWCPFPNFFKFLIYFENMKYIAEIENFQLGRLDAKTIESTKEVAGLSEGNVRAVLNIIVPVK